MDSLLDSKEKDPGTITHRGLFCGFKSIVEAEQ
jgi:hypothetical protein